MTFKIGDQVKFVNESIEGKITQFIDASTVTVLDSDGFELPVSIHEIVLSQDPAKATKKEEIETGKVSFPDSKAINPGVYLAFTKQSKLGSAMPDIYDLTLINDTNNEVLFSFSFEDKDQVTGIISNKIGPNNLVKISELKEMDLEKWPSLVFQLILFSIGKNSDTLNSPLLKKLNIKPAQFFKKEDSIPSLNLQGKLYDLLENSIEIPVTIKTQDKKPQIEFSDPGTEIDLHAEKLVEDSHILLPNQILKIQLDYFEKAVAKNLSLNRKEIILIHGSGSGILKHKIREYLKTHSEVKEMKDADKQKFGSGATEVHFY
jgi:hypothetical protein